LRSPCSSRPLRASRSSTSPSRFGAWIAAAAISAAAAIVFLLYALLGAFGCNGSDASEGVQPGTLGDKLCGAPLGALSVVCALVAIVAPLVGATRGWRGVAAGFTTSAGALTLVAIVSDVAFGDTWTPELFVGLPLAAFVAGVVLTTRRG
jgi:hypothetical protein